MVKEKETRIIDKALKDGLGPECYIRIDWNRGTSHVFDKQRKPKAGRNYILKCIRNDGERAYFVWKQM